MTDELGSPGLGLPYTFANFGLAEGLDAGLGIPVLGNLAVHIAKHQYSAELVVVVVVAVAVAVVDHIVSCLGQFFPFC